MDNYYTKFIGTFQRILDESGPKAAVLGPLPSTKSTVDAGNSLDLLSICKFCKAIFTERDDDKEGFDTFWTLSERCDIEKCCNAFAVKANHDIKWITIILNLY